jgi:hypothetical protein
MAVRRCCVFLSARHDTSEGRVEFKLSSSWAESSLGKFELSQVESSESTFKVS